MADHLLVIGRGTILADCSMAEFMADHAASYVRVKAPALGDVADLLRRPRPRGHAASTTSCGSAASTPPRSASCLQARAAAARADPGAVLARGRLHDPDRRQRGVPRAPPPKEPADDRDPDRGRDVVERTGVDRPGFGAVLRSEWIKLRTVRSTWWTLAATFVLGAGLTVLMCWGNADWLASRRRRRVAGLVHHLGDDDRPDQRGGAGCAGRHDGVRHRHDPYDVRRRPGARPRACRQVASGRRRPALRGRHRDRAPRLLRRQLLPRPRGHRHGAEGDVLRAMYGSGLYLAGIGLFTVAVGFLLRHTAGTSRSCSR